VPYRANTKYCADACRIRHLAREAARRHAAANACKHTRVCARAKCGTHFDRRRADAVYCSLKCAAVEAKKAYAARQPSRAKPAQTRPCEFCHQTFVAKRKTKRFCSDKCSFASWSASRRAVA
jgi:hypothetical protein